MGGTGWCTHPKRQLSNDVRIMVRKAELACRNSWGVDLWEAEDGANADNASSLESTSSPTEPQSDHALPLQTSFEDEVTSVVNTDIHRALNQEDDLNDRVVGQTSLVPDTGDDDEDDRFDLLARGGRDSVSEARNRMLRRRTGIEPKGDVDDRTDETLSAVEAVQDMNFAPDDYVEEETPSPEQRAAIEPKSPAEDDAILSEGVYHGTPRSRRLKRAREEPDSPKPQAVVEMSTDVATPAIEPDHQQSIGKGRFDSVPEISANVDLSRLRRQAQANERRDPAVSRKTTTRVAEVSMEEPFERAIRTAQAIKAAAKTERDGRKATQRSRPIAPPADRSETHHRFSTPEPAIVNPEEEDLPIPATSAERASVSSRSLDEHGVPGHAETYDGEDERIAPPASRQEDARGSWWRGLFQKRQSEAPDYQDGEDAFCHEVDPAHHQDWDDAGSASYIAASAEQSETDPISDWDQAAEPDAYGEQHDNFLDAYAEDDESDSVYADDDATHASYDVRNTTDSTPVDVPARFEPLNFQHEDGLSAFRDRLFTRDTEDVSRSEMNAPVGPSMYRSPIALARKQTSPRDRSTPDHVHIEAPDRLDHDRASTSWASGFRGAHNDAEGANVQRLAPEDLLDYPEDAWYEPEFDHTFDVRDAIAETAELLDMTIEIAPETPRACATCRSYRESEQGERGWCTNNWAFTHRQMVNATDLACQATIGCWWLPADEEVWLTDAEPERGATPRVDRLIAHLDPLKRAVGR